MSNLSLKEIEQALALFSQVKRTMRAKITKGNTFDSSAWLRMEVMKFIASEGSPKMKEIAEHLCIAAPSATSLVAGLIKNGFIESRSDARDRRTSRMVLTQEGKRELQETTRRAVQTLKDLFSDFSEDEMSTFIQLLGRIKDTSAH